MLYVQQSLNEGEELIHVGHFHWVYTLSAFMNIVWGLFFSLALPTVVIMIYRYFGINLGLGDVSPDADWVTLVRSMHPGLKISVFFFFLMGLLRYASMMIVKITTEIAVTSDRLVYKRGLVSRYVGEINIDRIEGVNVLQSVLGRLLGYGRVVVRGMGVGEVVLPPIEGPVAFRKSIERARSYKRQERDAV